MDWIIFGDEWHGFPTPIRHLANHLAAQDKIIWINALGTSSPKLESEDILQLWGGNLRAKRRQRSSTREQMKVVLPGEIKRISLVDLNLLPWHLSSPARRSNRMTIHREIQWEIHRLNIKRPTVLVINPIAGFYLDGLDCGPIIYYKTDLHEKLMASDRELIQAAEARMLSRADLILVSEEKWLDTGKHLNKQAHYLPYGIDTASLNHIREQPAEEKVLGFFDDSAKGLDASLIQAVSARLPEWTLDFVASEDEIPSEISKLENVQIEPCDRMEDFLERISTWKASWIPLTPEAREGHRPVLLAAQSNAAGLATAMVSPSTEQALLPFVDYSKDVDSLAEWLEKLSEEDSEEKRHQRKQAVSNKDWRNKVEQIYSILEQVFHKKTDHRRVG